MENYTTEKVEKKEQKQALFNNNYQGSDMIPVGHIVNANPAPTPSMYYG